MTFSQRNSVLTFKIETRNQTAAQCMYTLLEVHCWNVSSLNDLKKQSGILIFCKFLNINAYLMVHIPTFQSAFAMRQDFPDLHNS